MQTRRGTYLHLVSLSVLDDVASVEDKIQRLVESHPICSPILVVVVVGGCPVQLLLQLLDVVPLLRMAASLQLSERSLQGIHLNLEGHTSVNKQQQKKREKWCVT